MIEMFQRWCVLNGTSSLPASPVMIARFIGDVSPELGMDELWPIVTEISRSHYAIGLADPTAGGLVAAKINEIAFVEPPRSWPKAEKERFLQFPYDLQLAVAKREADRDLTIRRAFNERDRARQELEELKANGKQDATA